MKALALPFYLFVFFSLCLNAQAQSTEEITIKDTSGVPRAVSKVEGLGNVEFDLVTTAGDAAQGVEVSLTNATTGETIKAVAANGKVLFDGISPGTWTVASASKEVAFTGIAINSSAALAPLAGAAAAGGGLGLGGGTAAAVGGAAVVGGGAVAISAANDNDDSDSPLSPSS